MTKQRRKDRKKGVTNQSSVSGAAQAVSDDERHAMIAEAAYLLAERRDFYGDAALDDWLRAEAEINTCLPGMK